MKKLSSLLLVLLAFMLSLSAGAQGIITGSINGTVQDPTGAIVPGAKIAITNVETNVVLTVVSNGSGDFNFTAVPIGTYNLAISNSGFTTLALQHIIVSSGQAIGLGAEKLKTGGATETVEVSAAQSLLETTQSQVSTTFDQEQVANLPVGGGFDELALLIPGVVSTRGDGFSNNNGAGISSNGQRGRNNNFEIDGQSNNDNSVAGPQVFFSNADSLQEVQVITNSFSAQYGRDAGSVVNYVTKNGTNQFHGTASYGYSGSFLNSFAQGEKSPFQNYCHPGEAAGTNGCIPPQKQRYTDNQYGGSFGGPIFRDKLFGFGSALFDRRFNGASASLSGTGSTGYFPTPAAIAQLAAAYPNNPGVQSLVLYNPYSVTAGNPKPVGTTLNTTVTDGTTSTTIPVSQYSRFLQTSSTDEEVLGRLDYQATGKDRFFLRYFYQLSPNIAGAGNIATGGFVNVGNRTHSVGADWTHTFSSRITNQVRYSFQQSAVTFDGGGYSACTVTNLSSCPSSFGLSNSVKTSATDPSNGKSNRVSIGGFGLQTNLPQARTVKDTQIQDNANFVFGRHTIAFGGAFEYQNSPNVFLPTISGGFNFGSTGLGGPTSIAPLNGLLQGVTTLSLAAGSPNIHFTEPDWAVYVQDDWKVSSALTLNLGLRWEYFTSSINLLHNISLANQTGPNPLWNTALPLSVTTFPQVAEDYKHFEPRLGFAYNPSALKALVVRGGYSVNISPAFYNIFLNSYGSAPVVLATTITNCKNGSAISCIPSGGSNSTSVRAQDTGFLPHGLSPGQFNQTLVPSNFRQPYTQTYSLGVQYQIGRAAVVEARYVGAHTVGEFQSLNSNPNLANVAAFFPNVVAPSSLCTAANSTLLRGADIGRLHCGATNVRTRANTAFSIYNALQTQLTTRAYHGLTANLGYTFSRSIDNASEIFSTNAAGSTVAFSQNPLDSNVAERGVSGISFPNVTSLGLIYVDPHFKQDHSLIGRALGGFQLNTIYLFNSGQPYTPFQTVGDQGGSFCDARFNSSAFLGGVDTCRPILSNPNAPLGNVGFNSGNNIYIDTATGNVVNRSAEHFLINNTAEALALNNPYPGIGRNTLRGDSYNNVDASIFKNNKLSEHVNLQLQFQVFNVLNRAYYSAPDANLDDTGVDPNTGASTTTFGNFQGKFGTRRSTTLGARILF